VVDDRQQFDVGVAERDDAVGRPPRGMVSATDRREPVIPEQAVRRRVEIANGEDDVIDPQPARSTVVLSWFIPFCTPGRTSTAKMTGKATLPAPVGEGPTIVFVTTVPDPCGASS
jgi:hypothetical protein